MICPLYFTDVSRLIRCLPPWNRSWRKISHSHHVVISRFNKRITKSKIYIL